MKAISQYHVFDCFGCCFLSSSSSVHSVLFQINVFNKFTIPKTVWQKVVEKSEQPNDGIKCSFVPFKCIDYKLLWQTRISAISLLIHFEYPVRKFFFPFFMITYIFTTSIVRGYFRSSMYTICNHGRERKKEGKRAFMNMNQCPEYGVQVLFTKRNGEKTNEKLFNAHHLMASK